MRNFKFLFSLFVFTMQVEAKTVLIIGDSHIVGPFGKTLDTLLRSEGHDVATFGSCGSIAKWWFSGKNTTCGYFEKNLQGLSLELNKNGTPLITSLLNEIRPDDVILEFGANYFSFPSDQFVKNDIITIIEEIKSSGANCFFVTNPDSRKLKTHQPRLAHLLSEAVGKHCSLFNSLSVTKYPEIGGDGIHYSFKGGEDIARKWAAEVVKSFSKH